MAGLGFCVLCMKSSSYMHGLQSYEDFCSTYSYIKNGPKWIKNLITFETNKETQSKKHNNEDFPVKFVFWANQSHLKFSLNHLLKYKDNKKIILLKSGPQYQYLTHDYSTHSQF